MKHILLPALAALLLFSSCNNEAKNLVNKDLETKIEALGGTFDIEKFSHYVLRLKKEKLFHFSTHICH